MELGERMKAYEEAFRQKLPIRMPVIVRLDGKAFHTLTRNLLKPFDPGLRIALINATLAVFEEMPARMAYQQSDEVSFLLIDYNKFNSQQWFDGVVQKMVSVSASVMGAHFTSEWGSNGYFDSRVFPIPERDIVNYFVWRQQDCMTNAISTMAQAKFSPKELHGKHSGEMCEMLKAAGTPYESFDPMWSLGTVITRTESMAAPEFSKNRGFLEKFLKIEEE